MFALQILALPSMTVQPLIYAGEVTAIMISFLGFVRKIVPTFLAPARTLSVRQRPPQPLRRRSLAGVPMMRSATMALTVRRRFAILPPATAPLLPTIRSVWSRSLVLEDSVPQSAAMVERGLDFVLRMLTVTVEVALALHALAVLWMACLALSEPHNNANELWTTQPYLMLQLHASFLAAGSAYRVALLAVATCHLPISVAADLSKVSPAQIQTTVRQPSHVRRHSATTVFATRMLNVPLVQFVSHRDKYVLNRIFKRNAQVASANALITTLHAMKPAHPQHLLQRPPRAPHPPQPPRPHHRRYALAPARTGPAANAALTQTVLSLRHVLVRLSAIPVLARPLLIVQRVHTHAATTHVMPPKLVPAAAPAKPVPAVLRARRRAATALLTLARSAMMATLTLAMAAPELA